jgi:hypothetical protein
MMCGLSGLLAGCALHERRIGRHYPLVYSVLALLNVPAGEGGGIGLPHPNKRRKGNE